MKKIMLIFLLVLEGIAYAEAPECKDPLWKEGGLFYEATVVSDDKPLCGIEVYCDYQKGPMVITDVNGVASFKVSPVCGYYRCKVVTFIDPIGEYKDLSVEVSVTGNNRVVLGGKNRTKGIVDFKRVGDKK